MKNGIRIFLLLGIMFALLVCTPALADIPVDEENFPDGNFRSFVMSWFDTNKDGTLNDVELAKVTMIDCSYRNINSLKGIEHFLELKKLDCYCNNLAELDVSNNIALTYLDCVSNQLTTLDVSRNTSLSYLNCGGNQLITLDVSHNIMLTALGCGENQLVALDLSKNTLLANLYADNNRFGIPRNGIDLTELPGFDIQKASNYEALCTIQDGRIIPNPTVKNIRYVYDCGNNHLVTFFLTPSTAPRVAINADNFPDDNFREAIKKYDWDSDGFFSDQELASVSSIEVNSARISSIEGISYFFVLETLSCNDNKLTELDVSSNLSLKYLYCASNKLSELDVSYNTALSALNCSNNPLTMLDISHNPALKYLDCHGDSLTELDLSQNTGLRTLRCGANALTNLDLSYNTLLSELSCDICALTSLDLTHNTVLKEVNCSYNLLSTFALPHSATLNKLECYNNNLTMLDLSPVPELVYLECSRNHLAALDISGCPNCVLWGCVDNTFEIPWSGLAVSEIPGFKLEYASGYESNCTIVGDRIIPNATATMITYEYDCGNNRTEKFQLKPSSAPKVDISAEVFPDERFREIVHRYDNNNDESLSDAELVQVSRINMVYSKAESLEGIQYFFALTSLDCENCRISRLNLSANSAVQYVNCKNGFLTELNVSENTKLTTLYCGNNYLDALDLSYNTALSILDCSHNKLTSLDLSHNTSLTALYCYQNNLTSLDLSHNTLLTTVDCDSNPLGTLDVSHNSALVRLSCSSDKLNKLDVSSLRNLENLDCSYNPIATLGLSTNVELTSLSCRYSQITSLDLSANKWIQYIDVYGCELEVVDSNGSFDLSSLPGFDVSKANSWVGCTVVGTILTFNNNTASYSYDCGNGKTGSFKITRMTRPNNLMVLPQKLTFIESEAFANVSGKSFLLPNNIESIASDAFTANTILYYHPGTITEKYCQENRVALPTCKPYSW